MAAGEAWPYLLGEHLRGTRASVSVQVIGATGLTAGELCEMLDERRPDPPFDLVTVQAGVNDQYRGRAVDDYSTDLARLLERAVSLAGGNAERVLMVSIPDWSVTPHGAGHDRPAVARAIDAFNAAAQQLCRDAGAGWVDVTAASRKAAQDRSLVAADGLHPAPGMHRLWIEILGPAADAITIG